jgi:hypothetical protein
MTQLLLIAIAWLGAVDAKNNGNADISLSATSQRMNLQNAYPAFPSNPTYAVYREFSDNTCTELYQVVSYLENTCLVSAGSSYDFSCGNGLNIVGF